MSLFEQLKHEEAPGGIPCLREYLCPAGHITIGFGRNLEVKPNWPLSNRKIKGPITAQQAQDLLDFDITTTRIGVESRYTGFKDMSQVRQDACIAMAFQMGVDGFLGFEKMRRHLQRREWELARLAALDSQWAKQTPERANRVATQFITDIHYIYRG